MTALLLAAQAVTSASSGGWFLRNAWIIPLLPAVSFVLILFIGKRTPGKGAPIGIVAVAAALVLSAGVGVQWIQRVNAAGHSANQVALPVGGTAGEVGGGLATTTHNATAGPAAGTEAHTSVDPVVNEVTWFHSDGVDVKAGTMVDGLSAIMLIVVTAISLLVHVYSTDYVAGDRRYTHFFAFLSLFTASMLALVTASNTLMLITAWELVGMCSFALIGHWWEEKPNSDAAVKAFITNRVGDMGLLIGVTILYFAAGKSFDILKINTLANNGQISHLVLVVAACSLMAAVMSKSGQFFLHTWLPDAMAGPTPVSALIHAATMVVAGVFMVARLYSVFFHGLTIGGSSINLMALIGGITVLMGAALAFVQDDIKKVLAYSTISQLGYMVMALGVGAWTAAIFHLFTHAFFKACLFLGAGSVSHAVHSFDMKEDMGGLRKYMPKTFWTFLLASVALAGVFPLAGFWSKDEILVGTGSFPHTHGTGSYHAMLIMGVLGAGMTAAYMTRVIYLTFFGEFRGHGHPHESGARITGPLIVLATMSVVAGFVNLPDGFSLVPHGWQLRLEHYVEPVGSYFPEVAHANPSPLLAIISVAVALAGVAWAYVYYFGAVARRSRAERKSLTALPDGLTARFGTMHALHTFLVNKYYLDRLYTDLIIGSIKGPIARAAYWINQNVIDGLVDFVGTSSVRAGQGVYTYIDQAGIDGVINGAGFLSEQSGEELRQIQSGKIQRYATLLFGGATILAGVFILVLTT